MEFYAPAVVVLIQLCASLRTFQYVSTLQKFMSSCKCEYVPAHPHSVCTVCDCRFLLVTCNLNAYMCVQLHVYMFALL